MIFRWLKSRDASLELAKTLERENSALRSEVAALDKQNAQLMQLCRALRDVNADLDRKLLEAAK